MQGTMIAMSFFLPINPLRLHWSAIPVIVIVIVPLAEELLASLTLLFNSLLETLVSAIEMVASLKPNRTKAASTIARIVKRNSLRTSDSF
jgi:hypothetical protein